MSDLFTRSRTVILRNWRELSPKLAVGLLTGSATGFLLDLAAQNHITLSPTAQHFIVVAGFFVGGYIKSETFPTLDEVVRDLPKAEAIAEHVIHPPKVADTTSPVKIVPATPVPGVGDVFGLGTPSSSGTSGAFTKVIDPEPEPSPDEKPTEVLLPPYSRGGAFLDKLPSSQDNPLKGV
jgi:hypothetical protein